VKKTAAKAIKSWIDLSIAKGVVNILVGDDLTQSLRTMEELGDLVG